MLLSERIEAAASDMGMDGDGQRSGADHLLEFLGNHDLELVDTHSERACEARVVGAALALSMKAREVLLRYGDGTCQYFVESVNALHDMPHGPQTPMQRAGMQHTERDSSKDDDMEAAIVTMLRNMCAAPVFWRSRAKALLSRIDASEAPSPAVPPKPES